MALKEFCIAVPPLSRTEGLLVLTVAYKSGTPKRNTRINNFDVAFLQRIVKHCLVLLDHDRARRIPEKRRQDQQAFRSPFFPESSSITPSLFFYIYLGVIWMNQPMQQIWARSFIRTRYSRPFSNSHQQNLLPKESILSEGANIFGNPFRPF